MSDVYFREYDQCAIADLVKQVNELQQENQQLEQSNKELLVALKQADAFLARSPSSIDDAKAVLFYAITNSEREG